MARMCDVMTLACATVLAAGSVASADNKAALAAQPAVDRPTTPLTATAMWPHAPAQSGGAARALPGCVECPEGWFNGDVDARWNGQASHLGGGFPYGERAADDFHLCPGFVYDVSKICATLITNSNPYFYRARLQIFSDCNGCPDELLYQFDLNDANPTVTPTPLGPDIFAVDYCFTVDDSQPVAANRSIVLRGKCYWVSVQGISDGQGSDVSFFAATGFDDNGTPNDLDDDTTIVKGHQAKKDSGASSVPGHPFVFNGNWEDLDACCIGCTDLAFSVCVEPCKILIDNGFASDQYSPGGRSGERSERSAASNRNSRAADDFAVGTCTDLTLCYIEGCVYTNCRAPFSGFFEIYGNDCKFPDHLLRDCPGPEDDSEQVVTSGTATKIVPLGFSITQDGIVLQAYRLEFHDLSYVLPKARHYWISLGIDDTYSLTERALFCYNDNCPRECLVRFNPGAYTAPTLNCWETVTTNRWYSTDEDLFQDGIGRDFSFLIAGNYLVAGGSGSTCAADFNGDDQATVQDLFDFLSAWFTGCP